ncbi:molybdenum cofactor biosynthesis protein MoaB, partial [Staphylococcus gallinarum]
QLREWLKEDIDVIITTGGTGIAQRDVTIEAVSALITKEIEGFGELFRYLSYTEDVGTRALLSRAIAGAVGDKLIFSIPGSTGAVKLALNKLIKPELNHLVKEITK